jgi:hypothetical protein
LEETHNAQEAAASLFALQAFRPRIPQAIQELGIVTDNLGNFHAIRKQGTMVATLNVWISRLVIFAHRERLRLIPQWLPKEQLLQEDADSRLKRDRSDWKFNPRAFRELSRLLHIRFSVDLFATAVNKQCNKFVSLRPQPGALAIDALQLDWRQLADNHGALWVNPPWTLLARVLTKLIAERPRPCCLLLPERQDRVWWPLFLEASPDRVLRMEPREDLFLPGHLASDRPLGLPHFVTLVAVWM